MAVVHAMFQSLAIVPASMVEKSQRYISCKTNKRIKKKQVSENMAFIIIRPLDTREIG